MTFKEVKDLIKGDLYRYTGGGKFFKSILLVPGFKYMCVWRLLQYTGSHKAFFIFDVLLKIKLTLMQRHYGIQIPRNTKIGKGFYIGHYGTIVINEAAIIGDNVNISHGVTIGQANRGKRIGAAIIGNQVYIGPGAEIIGKVVIDNNVAIGANAVVTHDIPNDACVGGIPAKIISMNGAENYINRTV